MGAKEKNSLLEILVKDSHIVHCCPLILATDNRQLLILAIDHR